jgi:hypothetical protein
MGNVEFKMVLLVTIHLTPRALAQNHACIIQKDV